MCFSASASLTAAAVIGTVGIATLFKMTSRAQLLLASIPLLFALQQTAEGIIWLYVGSDHYFLQTFWKYFYLLLALIVWPTWIPLAVAAVEKIFWRKVILWVLLAVGIVVSAGDLYYLARYGAEVGPVGHSIHYNLTLAPQESLVLFYLAAVALPWFVSSLKHAWLFGALGILSFVVAKLFFHFAFMSVWCFFAAVLSVLVFKIVKDNPAREI